MLLVIFIKGRIKAITWPVLQLAPQWGEVPVGTYRCSSLNAQAWMKKEIKG